MPAGTTTSLERTGLPVEMVTRRGTVLALNRLGGDGLVGLVDDLLVCHERVTVPLLRY